MSSQAGLAGTVNHYDFLGIGLPGLDEIFAAASRVTPGDLGKAAARYLRADQAIGPHRPSS
jgi:predicted Zn-dependent peptidase